MVKIVAILLLTAILAAMAYAGTEQSSPLGRTPQAEGGTDTPAAFTPLRPLTIEGIAIAGLRRTQRKVIEGLLKPFIGLKPAELDLEKVKETLRETGLFDRIEASILTRNGGDAILSVELEEKLTLIPLPFIVYSSDGVKGGLMVMDMNAFGLNDKAVFGGILMENGWMLVNVYLHSPERPGDFGFNLYAGGTKLDTTIVDKYRNDLFHYDITTGDASASLLYRASELLILKSGLTFRERAVTEGPVESARTVSLCLGGSAKDTSWDGCFMSETSITASGTWYQGLVGGSFPKAEAHGVWEHPLAPGLRLVSSAGVSWFSTSAGTVLLDGPKDIGLNILPSDIRSRALSGVHAGLEYRLLKFRFGLLSLLASFEVAALDSGKAGDALAWGPVLGTRVYLSKVAFPAVDIGVSCNGDTGLWQFAGGIGFSF